MVIRPKRPRRSEFPFTIPLNVEPIATFMIQSNTVIGAMVRLLERRRYRKRTITAMLPMTMGCNKLYKVRWRKENVVMN